MKSFEISGLIKPSSEFDEFPLLAEASEVGALYARGLKIARAGDPTLAGKFEGALGGT